jgi:hypothetical protein
MNQAQQVEIRNEDWGAWNAWADGRIAAALELHEKLLAEATGAAMGEIRADLRVEFRKELEAATAKVGVELRELIVGAHRARTTRNRARLAISCRKTQMLRVNFHILQCGDRTAWLGISDSNRRIHRRAT